MQSGTRVGACASPVVPPSERGFASALVLASMLLPGLCLLAPCPAARAEEPPQKRTVAFKLGRYEDAQAGWSRVRVDAPMLYLQTPVAGDWSLEASWVGDSVSGASPRYHTQRSGASVMHDYRKAADVRLTRYFPRGAIAVSGSYSDEHDYTSRAAAVEARWSSEDNNRTWSFGIGHADDRIDNTSNGVATAIDERKRTDEFMVTLTQVLSPRDIVQVGLTRSRGRGYYSDPYKQFDQRPDRRDAWIASARWNHHLEDSDSTLKGSYRYYIDSFGVRSHTLGLDWVKPVGRWTWTPGVRYASQSAASFYFDPVLDASGGYDLAGTAARAASISGPKSADQRLSAFGAVTLSLKVGYAIDADTSIDVRLDRYRQSANWRLGGHGSPGLDAFDARFLQIGLTHRF